MSKERNLQTASKVSNIAASAGAGIAAGGAAAAALTTIGISAQAVPVIGHILGAAALIAGFIIKTKMKVNRIKSNIKLVDQQNAELKRTSVELDNQIVNANNHMASINNELNRLGISGLGQLGSFKTWLKKTFAPAKYQASVLKDKNQENAALQKDVEVKLTLLQEMGAQLENLAAKLMQGKKMIEENKTTVLAGGGILAAIILIMVIRNKKKKQTKK